MSDMKLEGHMMKWVNCCERWKQRYFILKDSILHYYVEKGMRVKGKIHITISEITPDTKNNKRFEINSGINTIYLETFEEEERKKWIDTLLVLKKKGQLLGPALKEKPTQAGDTKFTSADIKVLKKLYSTKELIGGLMKSNKNLNDLLSYEEINTTALKKLTESYKKNLEVTDLSFEDIISGFDSFAEDLMRFKNYFDGAEYKPNYLQIHKRLSNKQIGSVKKNINESVDENGNIINKYGQKIPGNRDHSSLFKNENGGEYREYQKRMTMESQFDSEEKPLSECYEDAYTYFEKSVMDGGVVKKSSVNYQETPVQMRSNANILTKMSSDINLIKLNNNNNINNTNNININGTNYKHYDEIYSKKRTKLPFLRKEVKFNVWEILRDAVGKDLSRFSMPVYLNEPLSMIQRFAEVFQYAQLLTRAGKESNPHLRIALVAAFCVAGFNNNVYRTTKFFNPILGETYELIDNELGFRYFGEQVSHHPAISAMHVEGVDYKIYANTNAKSKFDLLSNSLVFEPIGRTFVNFTNFDNELISYTKPDAIVRNIMFGQMNIDTAGKSILTNHNNGDTVELNFYEKGRPSADDQGVIFGELRDIDGVERMKFSGNWKSHLMITYTDENGNEVSETIWKTNLTQDSIEDHEKKYFFSDYAINLNNDDETLLRTLPRTDSRLRPDQRALERQDIELASKEKLRLEEKQRGRRKDEENHKRIYKPLYFTETYDDLTGELVYIYSRDYWEDKKNGKLDHFFDIYS